MVAQRWFCQGQKRWRKEHGLIIGMRNEQTDPLILQAGKLLLGGSHSVEPGRDEQEWND